MGKLEKILDQILRGGSDQNVGFDDLTFLLESLGFENGSRAAIMYSARPVLRKSSTFSPLEVKPSHIR
jgi:hypothetical protein